MNRIKIKRDIEYYKRHKENVLNLLNKVKLDFEQRRISFLEYKKNIEKVLQGKTIDYWINYYDGIIRNLERELKDYEFEARILSNRKILFIIIISFLLLLPLLYLFKIEYTSYVIYKIDKEDILIKSGLENIQTNEKYGILKFDHILSEDEKEELEEEGIKLLSYIPENSWIVSTDINIKKYKISKDNKIGFKNLIKNNDDTINLTVIFFNDINPDISLLNKYDADLISNVNSINGLIINIPIENLEDLLEDNNIQWVESQLPEPIEFNDGIRSSLGVNIVQTDYNLTGSLINIGEWDAGHVDNSHYDLINRILYGDIAFVSYHSTHVGGIAIGNGNQSFINKGYNEQWKGMAPNATIISYEWFNDNAELEQEYRAAIENYSMDISTNSWGLNVGGYYPCEYMGNYTTANIILDKIINGLYGKKILIIWAAGNSRTGLCGTNSSNQNNNYANIPPYGTGKNILTIGAINSDDNSMTSYSSWGPTDDGRIKPELVAPGDEVSGDTGIKSTIPGNRYTVYSGTSMAAPAVAGVSALIMEEFIKKYNYKPLPSTIKALLIHTAIDLGNKGPDYSYGYGKINATAAVEIMNLDIINDTIINSSKEFKININNEKELKLTLMWDDEAPTINVIKQLVNNLDLVVISPNLTRYYPFTLTKEVLSESALTNQSDNINIIEQIIVKNPENGAWNIIINNTELITQQEFSLVSNIKFNKLIKPTTSISPANLITNNSNIIFNCSAIDDIGLQNISFYNDIEGNFNLNQSINVTGTYNSTLFALNLSDMVFNWNCLSCNNNSLCDWNDENNTIIIDIIQPILTLITPEDNFIYDKNDILFSYNVLDKTNITCNLDINNNIENLTTIEFTKNLENNNYTWFISCVDSAENLGNSEQRKFTVNYQPPSPPSSSSGSGGGGSGGGRSSRTKSSPENIKTSESKDIEEKTTKIEKPVEVKEEQAQTITKSIEIKKKRPYNVYYYIPFIIIFYLLYNIMKVAILKHNMKKKRFIKK